MWETKKTFLISSVGGFLGPWAMVFFLSDAILMFLDTHYRQEDEDLLACKAILLSFQDICGWRERTEDSPESLGRFNIKMDQIEI